MSANTGVAPALWIVPAVAKKVKGVVITSSPRPMSSALIASSSASVPLAQPIACFVCDSSAVAFSSAATGLPRMNNWSSTTCITDFRTSSRMVACWAFRSSSGTGMVVVAGVRLREV